MVIFNSKLQRMKDPKFEFQKYPRLRAPLSTSSSSPGRKLSAELLLMQAHPARLASLKHIISSAKYYGASLFLLATDVVTAFVFGEPSLLSSLQGNGLTDLVLHAQLVKDVPIIREVLGSLPNVFSVLCLNSRGLHHVQVLPAHLQSASLAVYLSAMRRLD